MNDPLDPNARQIRFWREAGGERWLRLQPWLNRAMAPLSEALLTAAEPLAGCHAFEIGCGPGEFTFDLADAIGAGGRIEALDVSAIMLDVARRRDADHPDSGRAPIVWIEADAAAHAFAAEADLVVSRFGVMFFADPVAAFRNIAGALRPGGRLAMLCWAAVADNPWVQIPLDAAVTVVGPPPPAAPGAPGPYAFADTARIEAILTEAGFVDMTVSRVEADLLLGAGSGSDEAVADAVILASDTGAVSSLLRDVDEPTRARAKTAIAAVLRPHVRDGAIRLGAACHIFQARLPLKPAAPRSATARSA